MVLYRVKYSKDVEEKNYAYSKVYDDFSAMRKKAKELSKITNRKVYIEWAYPSNPEFWSLLRTCPNERDLNNLKPKQ